VSSFNFKKHLHLNSGSVGGFSPYKRYKRHKPKKFLKWECVLPKTNIEKNAIKLLHKKTYMN
jgi:hypothetical protein